MRWATAGEVVEEYPSLTEDDLTALTALGRLTWRSEPLFIGGRFAGAVQLYDISEVPALMAAAAVAELRAAAIREQGGCT